MLLGINNIKPLSIKSTVEDALRQINEQKIKLCFVVDSDNKLKKVVTDGDIRRFLLNNNSLKENILAIHDRQPTVGYEYNTEQELRALLNDRIRIIPIIKRNNELIDAYYLNDTVSIQSIKEKKIGVVGLGYVGLTLSVILADNGFTVNGLDTNINLIDKLIKKDPPFLEIGLKAYLEAQINNGLFVTNNVEEFSADVYIITVGTPLIEGKKEPNIKHVQKAINSIAKKIKIGDLVIMRSTLPVGFTREIILPIIEDNTGLKVGKDVYLAFCPERTAEGRALKELRKVPQIVGGFCNKSSELCGRIFQSNTSTVINVGSLEAAEFCKLLDNTYRDTVFAYSNEMSKLSEKLNLNLSDLIDSVNLGYERNSIPKPSPGVGGPCLSKDAFILKNSFEKNNIDLKLPLLARKINEDMIAQIYNRTSSLLSELNKDITSSKIFIMGFAFKGNPRTSDLRDSTTLSFVNYLKNNSVNSIYGFDFEVSQEDLKFLDINLCSIDEGFKNADAVFLMNNHRKYAELPLDELLISTNKPVLIFDSWNILRSSPVRLNSNVVYAGVGF